jgi:hypothetical protein
LGEMTGHLVSTQRIWKDCIGKRNGKVVVVVVVVVAVYKAA